MHLKSRLQRYLTSMPLLQWGVFLSLGPLPVLLFPLLPLHKTVGPFNLPVTYCAYGLWTMAVLILAPKAFRDDKSRATEDVDFKLEGQQRYIQRLQGELEQTTNDLQNQREQLAEMDRVMRIGFEGAAVSLPPRRMSLQASYSFDVWQPAITLESRAGLLIRWVQRPVQRFKKWLWG